MAVPARLLRAASATAEVASAPLRVLSGATEAEAAPRKRVWPLVATVVVSLALIFAVLVEQVVLAQSAFEVSRLREELTEARSLHEELLLESATLESPGRIERYARHKLGMVDPDPATTQYVVADIEGRGPNRGNKMETETVAIEVAP